MRVTIGNNKFLVILMNFPAVFCSEKCRFSTNSCQNPKMFNHHIFGKMKYDSSFVDFGPKVRVVALLSRHSPKMAKTRVEPQKMTCPLETGFFWGGSKWKIVVLGVVVNAPMSKIAIPKQKFTSGPKSQGRGVF